MSNEGIAARTALSVEYPKVESEVKIKKARRAAITLLEDVLFEIEDETSEEYKTADKAVKD